MGCCCACNIVCVGLLSILLTSPLLAPCILANITSLNTLASDSVDNSTTASSSILHTALAHLHVIPENSFSNEVIDEATKEELDIFIDGFIVNVEQSSVVTLTLASINICTNIFLIIGSCCKLSCLLLPWLVMTMFELVTIAIPATIFFSLLGVYLYFKGILIFSIIVTALPTSFLIIFLVMWFIVLAAYNKNQPKQDSLGPCSDDREDDRQREDDIVQPLMPGSHHHYNLGHYYPAHSQPQAPSAPPPSVTPPDSVYPTLPVQ